MILQLFLSSSRKRRRALKLTLYLLCLIRDAESDALERHYAQLDYLDSDVASEINSGQTALTYKAVEDDCLSSEHALDFLESALEDLEYVY